MMMQLLHLPQSEDAHQPICCLATRAVTRLHIFDGTVKVQLQFMSLVAPTYLEILTELLW
jgi:hypothetical protein